MTTGTKKKISVCTVTYNSAKDVERFLRSCEGCLGNHDLELIVVDNSSSDETLSLVERGATGLNKRVVRNERNVFYTRAMNEAMSLAGGEYILVVNPDCYFDAAMLDELVRCMDEDDTAGVCGPTFFYPDGRKQSSGVMFPSRRAFLDLALGRDERFFRWSEGVPSETRANVRYYDVLYGACFLIRRDFQKTVGKLDERLVHGWDEYDYCKRVLAHGKRCASVTSARCFHVMGASRSESLAPALFDHHITGLLHLARKHYGLLFEKAMIVCLKWTEAKKGPRNVYWKLRSLMGKKIRKLMT
jgi:GT2 family glycosyltransferase